MVGGILYRVPLIVDFTGSLKLTLRKAVLLKPPWEGLVQCGWSGINNRDHRKVMHIGVFLKLTFGKGN